MSISFRSFFLSGNDGVVHLFSEKQSPCQGSASDISISATSGPEAADKENHTQKIQNRTSRKAQSYEMNLGYFDPPIPTNLMAFKEPK